MKNFLSFFILVFLFILEAKPQSLASLLDSALSSENEAESIFEFVKSKISSEEELKDFWIAKHKHYSRTNDREKMMQVEKELLPILTELNDHKELTDFHYRISYYYEVAGLYDQAIAFSFKALDHAKKAGNPGLISSMYKSLSQNHRLFHDFDKAIEYGKLTFISAEEAGEKYINEQVLGLNITGAAFSEINEPDSAIYYYDKVLTLLPLLDSMSVAPTIGNIAYAYLLAGDIEKSRKYNLAALELFLKTDNYYAIAVVYINAAMTENQDKKYDQALIYLDSGIVYTQKSQYAEMYKWIYDEQHKIHKAMGNYPEALNSLSNLLTIKDSLFNTERAEIAKDLEIQYQTSLKDQEIAAQRLSLLEREKSLQRSIFALLILVLAIAALLVIYFLAKSRQAKEKQLLLQQKALEVKEAYINAALESQENERKRFAQDLHDGFGQLISALKLNISRLNETDNIQNKIGVVEKSESILKEMHTEIRNIAFNLMPATLIQYGLKEAIREFAQRINSSGKVQIDIDIHGLEERLDELQEISLYRVIQEWINNILKYAEAQKIQIQLVKHENEISVMIEDDGMGFDQKLLKNSKGNGWRNIQSRLNRINASLDLDTSPNRKGNSLIIEMPLSYKNQNV